MRDVIAFWCEIGIRTFRVDNPHTKPVSFWEYLIGDIHETYPDAIFLSEAFTRPKMMQVLAKVGFTQSYTYFTLAQYEVGAHRVPHRAHPERDEGLLPGQLLYQHPDILPEYLQRSGRPGFLIRAFLAATLSPVYGIYSGFELCENAPIPGKEEYIDSEKYQFKAATGTPPATSRTTSPGSTPSAATTAPSRNTPTCASTPPTTTTSSSTARRPSPGTTPSSSSSPSTPTTRRPPSCTSRWRS